MSKRYDEGFKLQVAQQCLHDDTSLREVARQHGVVGLRKKYTHRSAAPLADGSISTIVGV